MSGTSFRPETGSPSLGRRVADGVLGAAVRATGRFRVRRDLQGVCMLAPSAPDPAVPVLYVSNHATWWDGFLIQRLHDGWRQGPLVTVVADRHVRRHPGLRSAGCIGVDRESLSSLRTLLRSVASLRSIEGMGVSLFPQGSIQSSRKRPLGFSRGLDLIARAMEAPAIVPVAIHAEMLNHRKPTLFVLAGEPWSWPSSPDVAVAQDRVAELLDLVQRDVDEWGEEAPVGWRARMESATRSRTPGSRFLESPVMRVEEARA